MLVSRPLTLEVSGDQSSAVIGTMALEGRIGADGQQSFTLWMRPDSRLLFRAEFPDYRFGFWEQLRDPALSTPGLLRIERVSAQRIDGAWVNASFALAKRDAKFGSQLTIRLKDAAPKVRVYYHTAPTASGPPCGPPRRP